MLIEDMTSKECGEFLNRTGFGRLGCAVDNQAYLTPIYFAYPPDRLCGFSAAGQKIHCMRTNPKVCVEVDEVTGHFRWTSVIVRGQYQELPNTAEFASDRLAAQLGLENRILWWQTAYAAVQFHGKREPSEPLFYCIHISSMTGRRAIPDAADTTFFKISVP